MTSTYQLLQLLPDARADGRTADLLDEIGADVEWKRLTYKSSTPRINWAEDGIEDGEPYEAPPRVEQLRGHLDWVNRIDWLKWRSESATYSRVIDALRAAYSYDEWTAPTSFMQMKAAGFRFTRT